jgi:hypothetical protein
VAVRRRWSQRVTQESNALDLEPGVFAKPTARQVALSLRRSAEASRRRKGTPLQSAMSMLTFYVNRAGKNLSKERREVLERAKDELRRLYGRAPGGRHALHPQPSRRASRAPDSARLPNR